FWYIRNVGDDRITITGSYQHREDFINRDARALGYDGHNPYSIKPFFGQIYRNGDIRAHAAAWETIDKGFVDLLKEPQFKKVDTILDYEKWVAFKMKVIAYFYKKYCKISIIGTRIDKFSIVPKTNPVSSIAATASTSIGMIENASSSTTNSMPTSASSRQKT